MPRIGTVVFLVIALSAFVLLTLFGFAIWVFIPLLPAGIVFVIAVLYARKKATKPKQAAEAETNPRKAA